MATSISLDQKRLEQIRKQLYGKQSNTPKSKTSSKKESSDSQQNPSPSHHTPNHSSTSLLGTDTFIRRDLLKVAFLSLLAITLQLLIHSALINKWVHINFYGITY